MITLLILQAAMGQSVPVSDTTPLPVAPDQPVAQAVEADQFPSLPDSVKPALPAPPAAVEPESASVAAPAATDSVKPLDAARVDSARVDTTRVDSAPVVVALPIPTPPPMPPMAVVMPPPPPPGPVADLPPEPDHFGAWQIGVAAGDAGGYGLSLRRWFTDVDAIQLNLAPYLRRENVPGTDDPNDRNRDLDSGFRFDASISVGLTWLHSHAEKQFNRGRIGMKVLSYLAGSGFFEVEQQQIDHKVLAADGKTKTVVFDDYYRTTQEFQLGGGGGVEFSCWRLSVYALAGLGGWYEYTSEDFGFRPDGQLGLHFRF